ncbi:LysR family transcriptional regulator [Actinokineospora guangxiensis]|uniref:LysR family transcriptional regulator n=1 Tax=Actinokineospora guangxiensis TaxID=1490288 RepID=A0ABW0EX38_9PSEU
MHWDDLLAFRAVAMELSFTRAARKLNLSTSVVSQRVSRLERRLGETLLDRTTRRSVLTSNGHLVLMLVSQMNDQWRRIATLADGSSAPAANRVLKLGLPAWMPDHVMKTLGAVLPQGRTVLSAAGSEANLARLAGRKADFVLAAECDFSPLCAPPNAYVRTIHRDFARIAVPRSHPLATRERVSFRDLRGARIILEAVGSTSSRSLAEKLRADGRCRVVEPAADAGDDHAGADRTQTPAGAVASRAACDDLVSVPLVDDAFSYHVFAAWDPVTVDESLAADLHWLAGEHRSHWLGPLEKHAFPAIRLMGES